MVGKLHFVSTVTKYLFWISSVILINMTTKFRQFKKFHTCLTSRLTTSGARIGDLVVLFSTHFIPKRSHEKAVAHAKQDFFSDGVIVTPKHNTRVQRLITTRHYFGRGRMQVWAVKSVKPSKVAVGGNRVTNKQFWVQTAGWRDCNPDSTDLDHCCIIGQTIRIPQKNTEEETPQWLQWVSLLPSFYAGCV